MHVANSEDNARGSALEALANTPIRWRIKSFIKWPQYDEERCSMAPIAMASDWNLALWLQRFVAMGSGR